MAANKAIGSMSEKVTDLPPSKRYILTHDKDGKSIVHSSPPQKYFIRDGIGGAARSFATSSTPANLTDEADIQAYLSEEGPTSFKNPSIVPSTPGSNLLVIDIEPGGESPMHRTVSIDYSICVIGVVKMEMDDGTMLTLHPGDHVIQRGTLHKWYNGSLTEPARFVAVTIPCEPFEIPGTGKMLAEEMVAGTGAVQKDGSRL